MTEQTAITKHGSLDAETLESVVIGGDLSQLSPAQRVSYYMQTCNSLGLNPLTKPFDYLRLSGKLVLYARKDATEQLRAINQVSLGQPSTQLINDIYTVTITASTQTGRVDCYLELQGITRQFYRRNGLYHRPQQ